MDQSPRTGIGGLAPSMLGVLWSLTGITLIFVLLRLYTRVKIVQSYGMDDHFFNASFVRHEPRSSMQANLLPLGDLCRLRYYDDYFLDLRIWSRHGRHYHRTRTRSGHGGHHKGDSLLSHWADGTRRRHGPVENVTRPFSSFASSRRAEAKSPSGSPTSSSPQPSLPRFLSSGSPASRWPTSGTVDSMENAQSTRVRSRRMPAAGLWSSISGTPRSRGFSSGSSTCLGKKSGSLLVR